MAQIFGRDLCIFGIPFVPFIGPFRPLRERLFGKAMVKVVEKSQAAKDAAFFKAPGGGFDQTPVVRDVNITTEVHNSTQQDRYSADLGLGGKA